MDIYETPSGNLTHVYICDAQVRVIRISVASTLNHSAGGEPSNSSLLIFFFFFDKAGHSQSTVSWMVGTIQRELSRVGQVIWVTLLMGPCLS